MNVAQGDITIDVVHQHIHDGHLFSVGHYDAVLADDGFVDLLVVTVEAAHLRHIVRSGGEALLLFYEDTLSVPGSPEGEIIPVNRNRVLAASRPPTTLIYLDPALSSPLGDSVGEATFIPGGSGGNAQGFESRGWGEFILKPNASYLIRAQNISGQAQAMNLQLDWYE